MSAMYFSQVTGFELEGTNDSVAEAVARGECVSCGGDAGAFRTRVSGYTYTQQGECQACQDEADSALRVRSPR